MSVFRINIGVRITQLRGGRLIHITNCLCRYGPVAQMVNNKNEIKKKKKLVGMNVMECFKPSE